MRPPFNKAGCSRQRIYVRKSRISAAGSSSSQMQSNTTKTMTEELKNLDPWASTVSASLRHRTKMFM